MTTPIPVYQLDGSVCQGTNCVAASDAMLVSRSTAGKETPTAAHIRTLIGGACGGLTSDAVRYVNRVFYSLLCEQENAQPWSGLALASVHRGFILHGSYSVFNGTRFDASRNNFGGNHAVYVQGANTDGTWKVLDPLADGRYVGCPKGYEDIPDTLLRKFAGSVITGSGSALGPGLAMVLFSIPDVAPKRYAVSIAGRPGGTPFFVYILVNGVIDHRVIAHTGGFSATCTAPKLYHWPSLGTTHSLVQLTSGSRKGQYIDSKYARIV
jgi:hypothetical protein